MSNSSDPPCPRTVTYPRHSLLGQGKTYELVPYINVGWALAQQWWC